MGCGRSLRVVHVYRVVAAVPSRLYGVPLVVSVVGDEDVGGRQFIHLGRVVEVGADGDLGGIVVAGGGVGDDVVGRPFVVGGFFCRFQFEWAVERFWRRGLFLGLRVWRYFVFDQVLLARGLQGPPPGRLPLSRLGGARWCCGRGGGAWFGG